MTDTPTEPTFTLKASDPAAPFALLAYASAARNRGMSDEYIAEIRTLADEMYEWQDAHGVTTQAETAIRRLPDDHPTARLLSAVIDRRIGERERDKRIPHPSGDDGGDGMAWCDPNAPSDVTFFGDASYGTRDDS